MDKEYIEEITIANAATNYPGVDVSVIRDYMTGRTPEIKCKECKFKAAPLGGSTTYCNKQKRIVYASGCNYGELKPITNADRIRSLSDEELANWLGVYCNGKTAQEVGKPCVSDMGSCEECWLDWLKEEAKDDH